VVYAATPVPTLPEVAREVLAAKQITAALFFSAETAHHFVRLLQRARLHEAVRAVDALAIGQPAAVALQPLPWRRVCVAARPTQDAMLGLLQ
jgi:uroporphyrinogen-III synthase